MLLAPLRSLLDRLRRTPLRGWPTLELGVGEAALVWAAAFLVSAVLGVARQIMLNARFGLGAEAAAYYAAFRLPETLGVLIAGGALTGALVPVLLRAEADRGPAAAAQAVNLTFTALLVGFAPLCLGAIVGAPAFVRFLLAPGFEPATQALTATLTRVMLLEVLLVVSEAALVALLVSRNQILLPALAICMRNVTLIGGILLSFAMPSVGIYGPTVGAILDAAIQIIILVPGLRRRGFRPRLVWAPHHPDLRATLRLLWPNAISSLANYGGAIVDTAFATLVGAVAAVGALLNATLLLGLPLRLIGMAVGQALLPPAAALAARGELPALRRLVARTLLVAGGLSLLAAAALWLLGRPVIALLFQRGAFDAAAVELTAGFLALYALGLPGGVATEIASRTLMALYDARTPMVTNLGQLFVRATLCTLLIAPLGAAAIPIAFTISATAEAAVLLAVLHWRLSPPRPAGAQTLN